MNVLNHKHGKRRIDACNGSKPPNQVVFKAFFFTNGLMYRPSVSAHDNRGRIKQCVSLVYVTRDGFHGGKAAVKIVDSLESVTRTRSLKPTQSVRRQRNHGGFHVRIYSTNNHILGITAIWVKVT